jgi:hypothetical protein
VSVGVLLSEMMQYFVASMSRVLTKEENVELYAEAAIPILLL